MRFSQTLFILWVISCSVTAEDIMIFMDNSGSVKELSTYYHRYIEQVIDNKGDDTFYFIPIGNSKKDYREVQSKDSIQEVFKFNEQYTHIYGSLKRAEQSPYFNKVDKILIISDMEPDYQVSQAPWYFTQSEISSIKNTHRLLQHWSKDKEIHIVLQGWEDRPTRDDHHGIGEYETYTTLLQTQTKGIIPENNQKLVALSLITLVESKTVQLYATSKSEDKSREALRHIFCQTLPVKDTKMCGGGGGGGGGGGSVLEPSHNFTLTIDIAKPIPLSRYFPELRERIWDSQFIGPVRHFKIASLKKGIRKNTPNTDFYFKITPSKKGMSYSWPQVLAQANCRESNFILQPNKRLSSPEQATHWIASTINSELKSIINQCYPPPAPLKFIYLKDHKGQNFPGNYNFLARYTYTGNHDPNKTESYSIDNGTLELHIPHDINNAALYLIDGEDDTEYLIGQLPVNQIKSLQPLIFYISKDKMLEVSVRSNRAANIEIIYGGDEEHITVSKEYISDTRTLYLLPGQYSWYAFPDSDHILSAFAKFKLEPNGELPSISIDLESDPLANTQTWRTLNTRILDEEGQYMTGKGRELINSSAFFFKALLTYTTQNNNKDTVRFWKKIFEYIDTLPTLQRQQILKRSLLKVRLGDRQGNLSRSALQKINIMFEMYIQGRSRLIQGNSEHAQDTRKHYKAWIRNLLDYNDINRELALKLTQRR